MIRDIIKIDEEKCNGCGICIPNCAEGALQIIDGKARLISDLFCDGLGACIGYCPEDAISVERRKAEPYDEYRVMKEKIVPAGKNTIIAHIKHMQDHEEHEYLKIAFDYIRDNLPAEEVAEIAKAVQRVEIDIPIGSCDGDCTTEESGVEESIAEAGTKEVFQKQTAPAPAHFKQWPIQLHLISPSSSFLKNADLVVAADCSAYFYGNFYQDFIKNKALAIACPKLDSNLDSYVDKLALMIDGANLNTITVLRMEVPCCGGLLRIVQGAAARASRKVPIKVVTMSSNGKIIQDEWI